MRKLTLYTDGASRGNPGPGSYGFVILEDERIVEQGGARLGSVTNNFAEYQGVLNGLRRCLALGAAEVTVRSDSQLLVRQLNGQYKVRSESIRPLFLEVLKLKREFSQVRFEHVRREENSLADALANRALDGGF